MPISQIVTNSIANDAVTTVDIANAAVTPAKLSQPLTSGTAQASTSGTSIDFTSIPSWVKRITVMFSKLTCNTNSSVFMIQIGSGSVTTSGYQSQYSYGTTQGGVTTTGLVIAINGGSSTYAITGSAVLTLIDTNTWVLTSTTAFTSITAYSAFTAGNSPTLGGALDRVRITTVAGTAAFTAGTINILYE
jgi:hypothetical protein